MICMKELRFPSRPRAKVRRQGPPGSARAQPFKYIETLSLGMHSKRRYKICICSVILGELESFLNLRASVLFSRKF